MSDSTGIAGPGDAFDDETQPHHPKHRRDDVPVDAEPLLSLTTENGGLALGTTDGTIALYLGATATGALSWKKGVYDLEMIAPNGDVIRLVAGAVSVSREVTR